jgi:hypothetical protein
MLHVVEVGLSLKKSYSFKIKPPKSPAQGERRVILLMQLWPSSDTTLKQSFVETPPRSRSGHKRLINTRGEIHR